MTVDVYALKSIVAGGSTSSLKRNLQQVPVEGAVGCTTMVLGTAACGVLLCAALAEGILIMKYKPKQTTFVFREVRLKDLVL